MRRLQLRHKGYQVVNLENSGTGLGGASAAVRTGNVTIIPASPTGADQTAEINAALAADDTDVVQLGEGDFWVSAAIVIPDGKTLIGAGRDLTTINTLPNFGPLPRGNGSIVLQDDATVQALTLDGNKVNNGAGVDLRIHGVIARGTNFLVEDVTVENVTGYAFWANSGSPTPPLASGIFRNTIAENANVLYETNNADGVLFENIWGGDGDNDVSLEAAFHVLSTSSNITFRNAYYQGESQAVNIVANVGHQANIRFENVYGETTSPALAVFIGGAGGNEVYFINSTFKAFGNNVVNVNGSTLIGQNTTLIGDRIALFVAGDSNAVMTNSQAHALANPLDKVAAFALYGLGPIQWNGGHLAVSGGPGSAAAVGAATVTAGTTIVVGDNASVTEGGTTTFTVAANDRGANGAAVRVAEVEGVAVRAGESVILTSGAKVTLNADGTITYDPQGKFDWLAGSATGTPHSASIEIFAYRLDNGQSGQVTVTISGVTSSNDRIVGTSGNDSLAGTAGADFLFLQAGGDDVANGGLADDAFYFGSAATATDEVDGGAGADRVILQGNYSATLGAKLLVNVETLELLGGDARQYGAAGGTTHNYDLRTVDANVAAGGGLIVDFSRLRSSDSVAFDGSAETDGAFEFRTGAGNDKVSGGAQADTFRGGLGIDVLRGNGGDDIFRYRSAAEAAGDTIDGGIGSDTVLLEGRFNGGLVFAEGALTSIERIELVSGRPRSYFAYNLTLGDGNVGWGETLLVDGTALRFGEALTFYGSAVSQGRFDLRGGASNDVLIGGEGGDIIRAGLGGDTLRGNGGNDSFFFDSVAEIAGDIIDGGSGSDRLVLNGRFNSGVAFAGGTLTNVERIELISAPAGSFAAYNLTVQNGNLTAGQTLVVDGAALRFGEALSFYGHNALVGSFDLRGGASNDLIFGGQGDDTIHGGLGVDTLRGNGGADVFVYGSAAELSADRIDGGAGTDRILLLGAMAHAFAADAFVNVEEIVLGSRSASLFRYDLVTHDANVTAGQSLLVDGSALAMGETLSFNGSAETNGRFEVRGGAGADVIRVGLGADVIRGNNGSDTFFYDSAAQLAGDSIDGGIGFDTLVLNGRFNGGVEFQPGTLTGVERIELRSAPAGSYAAYNLTVREGNVSISETMVIDASVLRYGETLTFYGQNSTSGRFDVYGGASNDVIFGGLGNDSLRGGAGNDLIRGGGGSDHLAGNAGSDVFAYRNAAESTGRTFDVLADFDPSADRIDLVGTVAGWAGPVSGGELRSASFDADLAAALDSSLGANEAVLFTAGSGDYVDRIFLIVDGNGDGLYRSGDDYVFELAGPITPLTGTPDIFI
jgi:Ca2+-binding RTX toxin-like protein